ncbi:MAG: SMC-Scp complex subunit ScpB [Thermodesulfobacteriota bacterium]
MTDRESLIPLVEALIFAADHPVTIDRLAGVLEGEKKEDIKAALGELMERYSSGDGGLYIEEVAGGYQMRTRAEYAPWMRRLFKIGMQRVSKAAMETLAIVAYKQPITKGELEEIRGVDSGGVLRTLLDRRLIKMVGRKDTPGRPVVYGTTKEFLETFDLKDLSHLPALRDIESLEDSEDAATEEELVTESDAGEESVEKSLGAEGDAEEERVEEGLDAEDNDDDEEEDEFEEDDDEEEPSKEESSEEESPDEKPPEEKCAEEKSSEERFNGKAPEGDSQGGDNVEEEGRGTHPSGQGPGKQERNS